MSISTMMEEKWTVAFKLLDFNKDGVISGLDRDECKKSFLSVYRVTGQQSDTMIADLDMFWNKSVFLNDQPDWSKSFTLNDILKTRQASYERDQSGTAEVVREAMTHLIRAADVHGTKTLNFEEFKRLHEAFNLQNEELINGIFAMTSADGKTCPCDSLVGFYTELTMGSDESKHAMYKAGLTSAGFL